MTLAVSYTTLAVGQGVTASFLGVGGVGPYSYSVIVPDKDGAGGSIASNGIYTAPQKTGQDIIQVTDSLGATATAPILVGTYLELFCDIIKTEMGLDTTQVYFWDQKINTPIDEKLYIAVSEMMPKAFANSNAQDASGNQVQSTNFMTTLVVDILSRGPEARTRKEELIMALNSIYSEQQQEANSFSIAKIPSNFVNLSNIDGAAIPYRFNISINVQYMVRKTSAAPFFSSFNTPGITTES